MVQQKRKITRKSPGDKVKRVNSKSSLKETKTVNKKNTDLKNLSEHTIVSFGQKVKILNDISTVDGTLYKGEIVRVDSIGKNLKVVDNLGRFWFVNNQDITNKL